MFQAFPQIAQVGYLGLVVADSASMVPVAFVGSMGHAVSEGSVNHPLFGLGCQLRVFGFSHWVFWLEYAPQWWLRFAFLFCMSA